MQAFAPGTLTERPERAARARPAKPQYGWPISVSCSGAGFISRCKRSIDMVAGSLALKTCRLGFTLDATAAVSAMAAIALRTTMCLRMLASSMKRCGLMVASAPISAVESAAPRGIGAPARLVPGDF